MNNNKTNIEFWEPNINSNKMNELANYIAIEYNLSLKDMEYDFIKDKGIKALAHLNDLPQWVEYIDWDWVSDEIIMRHDPDLLEIINQKLSGYLEENLRIKFRYHDDKVKCKWKCFKCYG